MTAVRVAVPLSDEVEAYLRGRPDLLADPYPLYERLRAEAPVFACETFDQVLVARHEDISFISLHPESFLENTSTGSHAQAAIARVDPSERERLEALLAWFWEWMPEKDGAEHRRLRGLTRTSFTKRNIVMLGERIDEIIDSLLEPLSAQRHVELIAEFAYQLPMIVICEMLDVPAEDRHLIRRWATELGRFIGTEHENVAKGYDALLEFREYLLRIIERRRGGTTSDLLGALIAAEEDGDRLSNDELWIMMTVFLFAGHETTTNMIGNSLLALLRNRSQWELLVREPDLCAPAVEELLRYDTSVQTVRRVAVADIDLGATPVAAGATVRMLLGSANRDAGVFEHPERLDLRRRPDRQLAFGIGVHHCLGNQLARLELQRVLGAFSRRFPDIALAGDVEWRTSPFLRGPERLPLDLGRDRGVRP